MSITASGMELSMVLRTPTGAVGAPAFKRLWDYLVANTNMLVENEQAAAELGKFTVVNEYFKRVGTVYPGQEWRFTPRTMQLPYPNPIWPHSIWTGQSGYYKPPPEWLTKYYAKAPPPAPIDLGTDWGRSSLVLATLGRRSSWTFPLEVIGLMMGYQAGVELPDAVLKLNETGLRRILIGVGVQSFSIDAGLAGSLGNKFVRLATAQLFRNNIGKILQHPALEQGGIDDSEFIALVIVENIETFINILRAVIEKEMKPDFMQRLVSSGVQLLSILASALAPIGILAKAGIVAAKQAWGTVEARNAQNAIKDAFAIDFEGIFSLAQSAVTKAKSYGWLPVSADSLLAFQAGDPKAAATALQENDGFSAKTAYAVASDVTAVQEAQRRGVDMTKIGDVLAQAAYYEKSDPARFATLREQALNMLLSAGYDRARSEMVVDAVLDQIRAEYGVSPAPGAPPGVPAEAVAVVVEKKEPEPEPEKKKANWLPIAAAVLFAVAEGK